MGNVVKITYLCTVGFFLFIMVGCRSYPLPPQKEIVEVRDSVVLRDSVVITSEVNRMDSVYVRDSTIFYLDTAGNIIRSELYQYKEVTRELSEKYDALLSQYKALQQQKSETNVIPYPVEKELTWWQETRMRLGELSLIGLILFIGIRLFKLFK